VNWKKLVARLDDGINPIVVKELRQAVQSKFVSGVIYLFLLVQLLYLGIALIENDVNSYNNVNFYTGRRVCMILLHIMMFMCIFFVPTYAAVRFASERSETNVDLLFITTIKPWNIIWGKLLSAMVLTLLLYSLCMPFMSFTYLLRGIDLPTIFLLLLFDFLIVAVMVQIALLLACLPTSRLFKMLLALLGLGAASWVYGISVVLAEEFMRLGVASTIDTLEFWAMAGAVLVLMLTCLGLPFVLSLTVLTPPSANRALPVRLYLAAAWLLCGIAGVLTAILSKTQEAFIFVWLVGTTLLFSAAIWVAVSERESPGRRVAQTIPRSRLKRHVAFLFYSGAANGVLFSLLILGLTALAMLLIAIDNSLVRSWSAFEEVTEFCAGIAGYVFCYSLSAVAIRRKLLGKRLKQLNNSALAFLLVALGSIVPILLCYLIAAEFLRDEQGFIYWLNPFAFLVAWRRRELYLSFLLAWSCIMAVSSLPWIGEQIKRFRPLDENSKEQGNR
jgi:hypothetical protein